MTVQGIRREAVEIALASEFTDDGDRMNNASAHYEPLLAMGWMGNRPEDNELAFEVGAQIPPHWCDVVADRRLRCGIDFRVERRGFAVYDFEQWTPGVVAPVAAASGRIGRFWTFGEYSEGAKPALVQRMRVMNAHLTLIHAAAAHLRSEHPLVSRLHERDLYRFDYPEESAEGYWYRPLGRRLPDRVTELERIRIGVLDASTLALSLDWLDMVVVQGVLVEFDLLNQAQVAARAHDYPLAVVGGWTVCELRIRQIARDKGMKADATVHTLTKDIRLNGPAPNDLTRRLDELRKRRNNWLHYGREPDEQTALEAVSVSAEMLKSYIPALTVGTRPDLLIL